MNTPKKEKSIFIDLNKIVTDATPEQFNKLVDLLEKIADNAKTAEQLEDQSFVKFPFKDAEDILENSTNVYEDLSTYVELTGEKQVFEELRKIYGVYMKEYDKLSDQLDLIEGRMDDMFEFTKRLNKSVRDVFENTSPEKEYKNEKSKYKEKCPCHSEFKEKESQKESMVTEDFPLMFDFSELGNIIKELIDTYENQK